MTKPPNLKKSLPNPSEDIDSKEKDKTTNPITETNVTSALDKINVTSKLEEIELIKKSERQLERLKILKYSLVCVTIGLIASISITCIFMFGDKKTPSELIVLNTILGSTLTTIIGVIAGSSID